MSMALSTPSGPRGNWLALGNTDWAQDAAVVLLPGAGGLGALPPLRPGSRKIAARRPRQGGSAARAADLPEAGECGLSGCWRPEQGVCEETLTYIP